MRKPFRLFHFAVGIGFLCLLARPAELMAYQDQLDSLGSNLLVEVEQTGHKSVAVVDFSDLNGNITELGRFVAEEVSAALVEQGRGLQVVDRLHLNRIIEEHKLATTGLIDPDTARQIGKFAGVELLVTGTLTSFGDTIRVSAKLLDIETARIIASKRANLPKTEALAELDLNLTGSQGAGETRPGPPSRAASGDERGTFGDEKVRSHREREILFELHGCRAKGTDVHCELTVTNEGDDRELSLFGKTKYHSTKIYDQFGGEHFASRAQLGEFDDASRVNKMMIKNIPIPASFSFIDVPEEAAQIAVLEITFAFGFSEFYFKFRSLPLFR